ncbi:MAG TPA: gfo/Idh/MocA family oxidoreductase, partial [Phycisphaerae bacterium]|nr:gfo/Idh/MocA family oxidoreductase [Phycisphaerae bacterium]
TIIGTDGYIRVHPSWWRPSKLTVKKGGKEELIEAPSEGNGYNYQAAEVGRCLREGKLESDVMGLDETLSIMRTMDQIRAQWGLKYPME